MLQPSTARFPDNIRDLIIEGVNSAICEDLPMITRSFYTKNSKPFLCWDLAYKNIHERVECFNCNELMDYNIRRGAWGMLFLYFKELNCICTFMREERFITVRKEIQSGKNKHYLGILANTLNQDLEPEYEQTSLLTKEDDIEIMRAEAKKMLFEIIEDGNTPSRHCLVLISSQGDQLTSIRLVCVCPNLEIHSEENWTEYIRLEESLYSELATAEDVGVGQPSKNLKLSKKAHERKKKQSHIKVTEQENEESS